MAGLFGYAAAGAIEGYGRSVMSNALALREAAFKEAEEQRAHSRLVERDESTRKFTAEESAKDRDFRSKEGAEARRVSGSQLLNDESGNLVSVFDSKATPVTDAEGKPVKGTTAKQTKTDFDRKYELALEIFGGDKKKALDVANGVRAATPAQAERLAQDMAKSLSRKDFQGNFDPKEFDQQLTAARKKIQELFSDEGEGEKSSRDRISALEEKAVIAKFPNAKKAPDGNWYIPKPGGGFQKVVAE